MNSIIFKDILACSASICSILQFLAGMLVCKKFVSNKSTGESSGLAFVTCFLSCSLWLFYGELIQDKSIIIVNLFGSSLQFFYTFTYYTYSIKKKLIVQQMSFALIIIGLMYVYMIMGEDLKTVTKNVGFITCAFTILFFASPLTMLTHVIRVKSAESLPFPVILATFVTSFQWFLYGYFIDDFYIQMPNFLGSVLSAFQLILFIIFPNKKSSEEFLI